MSRMKVERVTDHITRVERPVRLFGFLPFSVAVWLVRAAEALILVDAGPQERSSELVATLHELTHGKGVRAVLLTHGHPDHAGGLTELRLAWNPPVACHTLEAPFVLGQRSYGRIPSRNVAFWIGEFLMSATPWAVSTPQPLEHGQRIFGMEVLHLPGHTPGQVAFLHHQDRAVICGDVVMNLMGRLSGPPILATPDLAQARRSIARLAELDFEHLLPSHGPPILANGRRALLAYLQRSKRRLLDRGGD
jgi:glyoxylase-like metal-dependent hydrolase (beta-lactamase superfamily II)